MPKPPKEHTPSELPCGKGHRGNTYTVKGADGVIGFFCSDCRRAINRGGRESRPVLLKRDEKIAALAAGGATIKQIVEHTGAGAKTVAARLCQIRNGSRPDLQEVYRLAKHAAAERVLPLAQEAAVESLNQGLAAIRNGTQRCAGLDESGKPVMVTEMPSLRDLSPFLRETAHIAGVGKGGVLASDGEEQEHEIKKAVVSKIQWNDPAVLAAAMQMAGSIASGHEIDVTPQLPTGERNDD